MLKNLISINLQWLKVAFYAGAAVGTVVGVVAGGTFGLIAGAALAFGKDEMEKLDADDAPEAGQQAATGDKSNTSSKRVTAIRSSRKRSRSKSSSLRS